MYNINEIILYSSTSTTTVIIGIEPFPSPFSLGRYYIAILVLKKGRETRLSPVYLRIEYTYRKHFIIFVYTILA